MSVHPRISSILSNDIEECIDHFSSIRSQFYNLNKQKIIWLVIPFRCPSLSLLTTNIGLAVDFQSVLLGHKNKKIDIHKGEKKSIHILFFDKAFARSSFIWSLFFVKEEIKNETASDVTDKEEKSIVCSNGKRTMREKYQMDLSFQFTACWAWMYCQYFRRIGSISEPNFWQRSLIMV